MNIRITEKLVYSLLTLSLLFVYSATTAQTNINYSTWTGAQGCNIFGAATNVPATLNGFPTNINHQTVIGQPTYDNVNKTVNIDCIFPSTGQARGTEYLTTVNFKVGHSYKITITASRIQAIAGSNPSLRLDLNNGGNGGNSFCNGFNIIDPNTSGNLKNSRSITSNAPSDYIFNYNALASAQIFMLVAAVPPLNSSVQTILIKSIKIEETPPPANFTLTPSTLVLQSGISSSQLFTVTNVNNTPNVTGYSWNLGATPNGWQYNGVAAPSTISTSTNSISLSSVACATVVNNVAASAIVGAVNYPTNICTVTLNNPNYSISGPDILCNSSTNTFSINTSTCNANVNWTVSASAGGTVTLSNNTGSSTSVIIPNNFPSSALITLTATVSGVANPITKTISYGQPNFGGSYNNGRSDGNPLRIFDPFDPSNSANGVCIGSAGFGTYVDAYPFGSNTVTWSVPSGYAHSGFSLTQQTGNRAYFTFNYANAPTGYLRAVVSNSCGTYDQIFAFSLVNCNPTGGGDPCAKSAGETFYTITPNPASDRIKIGIEQKPPPVVCRNFAEIATDKGLIFSKVVIYNNNGAVLKQATYKNAKSSTLAVADLRPGIYIVEISQGTYSERHRIIITK